MDHITQLYQNRAKVLQEEVNRLEALLEAVQDIDLGNIVIVPTDKGRTITTSSGSKNQGKKGKESKKTEPSSPATGNTVSVYGQPVTTKDVDEQDPYEVLSSVLSSAPGSMADYVAGGIGSGIYTAGTKALENWKALAGLGLATAVAGGVEGLAKKATGKTITGRIIGAIKAASKEKARLADVENSKKILLRMVKSYKPGDVDPVHGPLRSSTIPAGKVDSLQTGGRAKAISDLAAMGKEIHPELTDFIEPKGYKEPHKYLKSIGAITPEDIAAAGQGAKDIAMTGREVGRRTAQLAKGAIGAAGKGLNMIDPLSLGAEAVAPLAAGAAEVAGGLAMAPLAIGLFTSEAGRGSDIVAPTEYEIKAKEDMAKEQEEQRKQQGLAPVDSITSPTSAVDAASLGAVTVSQQDRAKLERQAMGAKTSTPNLDRIQKQREMLKLLQSGPRMFGGGVK